MASSEASARDRLVLAAADMLRRRGLYATSIREVAKHAKAPLGSTYHYFPGGKTQMVSEAVAMAGDYVSNKLRTDLQAGPMEGIRSFFAVWRDVVRLSDYRAGCPVLAVAVEEPEADIGVAALDAAGKAFDDWQMLLASNLNTHGVDEGQARQVAHLVIAATEGSIALCRAMRSVEPLDNVAAQLERYLEAVLRRP